MDETQQQQEQAPPGSPQDVLDRARQMLFSAEMSPIVETALVNSKDLATGAAMLLAPVLLRISQETDIEDDELLGSAEGDGIAVYLLGDLFDVAAEAGIPGAEDRQMAEKAAQILDQMLGQMFQQEAGAEQQQQAPQPPSASPAPAQNSLLMGG